MQLSFQHKNKAQKIKSNKIKTHNSRKLIEANQNELTKLCLKTPKEEKSNKINQGRMQYNTFIGQDLKETSLYHL